MVSVILYHCILCVALLTLSYYIFSYSEVHRVSIKLRFQTFRTMVKLFEFFINFGIKSNIQIIYFLKG